MSENLVRISLTVPKKVVDELDEQFPNRSFLITKLLKEKFEGKNSQIIKLSINSKNIIRNYLDPNKKFFLNIDKLSPILAVSVEKNPSDGPEIKIITIKENIPILIDFNLSSLKDDADLITDAKDWLDLIEIYEDQGDFMKLFMEKNIIIADKINL
jgi:hypothetical protein